jgi:hypothetical protein
MKIFNYVILLFAGIWLSACSSSSLMVRSDYDRQANFRQYTTYRIEPVKNADKLDPVLNSSINQKRINQALEIEMKARGYVQAGDEADLVISYQTDSRDRQEVRNNNPYLGGYYYWWRNNTQVRNYNENRLIINMVDATTNQLVWQGWATGEWGNNKKDMELVFREAVYKIMKEYPHRAGGQTYQNPTSSIHK